MLIGGFYIRNKWVYFVCFGFVVIFYVINVCERYFIIVILLDREKFCLDKIEENFFMFESFFVCVSYDCNVYIYFVFDY